MACWVVLILATVACAQGRHFNNPIMSDESYQESGTIKYNGSYYLVSTSLTQDKGLLPLHTSNDLINWTSAGYVINAIDSPWWTVYTISFNPEIHQIGDNFLVYFAMYFMASDHYEIRAAIAQHPGGPYTPLDQPILWLPNEDSFSPNLINDEGKIYLLWLNNFEVKARQLSADGMNFTSELTTTLLLPSLSWEEGRLYTPWYIRRGSYHYLLYSGGKDCSNWSVGVARSLNSLGPYEKLSDPILVSNSKYSCMSDVSVVRDLDDNSDVMFLTALPTEDSNGYKAVLLASLNWNAEDWPYVQDL